MNQQDTFEDDLSVGEQFNPHAMSHHETDVEPTEEEMKEFLNQYPIANAELERRMRMTRRTSSGTSHNRGSSQCRKKTVAKRKAAKRARRKNR